MVRLIGFPVFTLAIGAALIGCALTASPECAPKVGHTSVQVFEACGKPEEIHSVNDGTYEYDYPTGVVVLNAEGRVEFSTWGKAG